MRSYALALGNDLLNDLLNDEDGQSTVEYMLLISVIVIALVAAAWVFVPQFQAGVKDLGMDVKKMLSTGKIGKAGTPR